jgi:hypothetical protein
MITFLSAAAPFLSEEATPFLRAPSILKSSEEPESSEAASELPSETAVEALEESSEPQDTTTGSKRNIAKRKAILLMFFIMYLSFDLFVLGMFHTPFIHYRLPTSPSDAKETVDGSSDAAEA